MFIEWKFHIAIFISRSYVLDNNRPRTRSAKWKALTWVGRPPLRSHLPCHLLCTHLVDRSKEDGNNKKWNIYYVRKEKKEYWYWRKLNCLHWLVFTRLVQIWTPTTCTQQAKPKICFLCFDLYQIFDLNHFRRASNWIWFIFDWYCQSKYVLLILIYVFEL